jgi:hypothetical protein
MSSDEYVKSLENRNDYLEKQLSAEILQTKKEKEFISFARRYCELQRSISFEKLEEFFSDDIQQSYIKKLFINMRIRIRNFICWIKEDWVGILVVSFVVCLILGLIYAAVDDIYNKTHNKDIAEKIDKTLVLDLNNDNIVTDDECKIFFTNFMIQNNLKINEQDLQKCIREKIYNKVFFNTEKKLSGDEVYELLTKTRLEK